MNFPRWIQRAISDGGMIRITYRNGRFRLWINGERVTKRKAKA